MQYILVFGIGYALFFQMHRFCPNFTIYILVDPVSLKLLAAGAKFWVLNSFYGENFGFLLITRLIFHPQLGLEPQLGVLT